MGLRKLFFLKIARTLEWMNLETDILQGGKALRNIGTCYGFFQNLDQRPNGALKTVFLKYG